MAADFSRVRLNPLLDYAGVELKQGGVLLDADANELVAILDRRFRALASDTLGRATVSSTTPVAFKIEAAGGSLTIDKGRLYVDGLLAENHGVASTDPAKRAFDALLSEPTFTDKIDYDAQPYLPQAPVLPESGRHLVYLDVWNRELTHLEQPELVESAVAVETSSRLQTVWQVRVLDEDAGTATTCASPDGELPGWAQHIAPSTGVLTTDTFEIAATDDPCELPPTGGYRGLENQLYRVQIHDPGQPGAAATFKWSRENASVGSRVASMVSATELELETLGRDDVLRINAGDWVEVIDDVRELSQAAGEMRRVTVDDATKRITLDAALPASMLPGSFPDSAFAQARNLRVHRWDQKGLVFRTDASGTPVQVQDLDAPGSAGVIAVPAAGTTLLLENGVTVSFASTGSKGFKAGDHWEFAARTADASVEILDRAPPRGIHHHYARLGLWDVAAATVTDCRNPWPPAGGGGDCTCTVCVTPESHASGQLTLQDAVNRARDTGGTICLHSGQYALREPVRITGATSLRVRGQGVSSVVSAAGSAFIIERSAAIVIEAMAIVSLGNQSAISVRSVIGLTLRELAVAVVGGNDARGAAVSLAGVVAGAAIENTFILAPDGIRAGEPADDSAPNFLISAALHIEHNVLWCQRSGVSLIGNVAHLYQTRIRGNELLGCRTLAVSALGLALPGASMHIDDNSLNVNGPGIRCAVDGAWIQGNKVNAVRQGDRAAIGAGITLASGLDVNGSDQCQLLANQVSGFPLAGIVIDAPVQSLLVKLNIVERCGNGIVMTDAASAASVAVENNQLRDIGGAAGATGAAGTVSLYTAAIAVARTESATVAGNHLRRIGLETTQGKQLVAGILGLGVLRSRVIGNELMELGPSAEYGGTVGGIMLRAPHVQAEVSQNQVEPDAQPSDQASATAAFALVVDEPLADNRVVSRLAGYTTIRADDARTLVLSGTRGYVFTAAVGVNPAGAPVRRGPLAAIAGNLLNARGRVPAVDVTASGELLFSGNRCELRANESEPAVQLTSPVVILNANRVRSPGKVSIRVVSGDNLIAAIGNITSGAIAGNVRPEMQPLNLNA